MKYMSQTVVRSLRGHACISSLCSWSIASRVPTHMPFFMLDYEQLCTRHVAQKAAGPGIDASTNHTCIYISTAATPTTCRRKRLAARGPHHINGQQADAACGWKHPHLGRAAAQGRHNACCWPSSSQAWCTGAQMQAGTLQLFHLKTRLRG